MGRKNGTCKIRYIITSRAKLVKSIENEMGKRLIWLYVMNLLPGRTYKQGEVMWIAPFPKDFKEMIKYIKTHTLK